MPAEGIDTGSGPVAVARPASTVLLGRDAADGVEVLLVERHGKLRFMGGMHVFPGGAVHAADSGETVQALLAGAAPARRWSDDTGEVLTLSLAIAAIRETFEEVGLWLGATPEPAPAHALRERLLAGEDFGTLLQEAGWGLSPASLQPLSRWITPRSEPIRFDTRFYVARAPHDQSASHDARETVSLIWRSPRQALQDAHAGRLRLSPPTYLTLHELEELASTDALLAHCERGPTPIIEPIMQVKDGVRTVLYPGDPEHPVQRRALKGPTRVVF